MERQLCLVLDAKGEYRLILEQGSDYEIDEYTSKYFENSMQIRKAYEDEINEFLIKYKNILKQNNNPNYKGRIVIVKPEKVGSEIEYYQKKVLYKKHIIAFNKSLKTKNIMNAFVNYEIKKGERTLIPMHIYNLVRYNWERKRAVTTAINKWIQNSKEKNKDFYEIVRDMLTVYLQEQANFCLTSIDELYENYKNEKEQKIKERLSKRGKLELQKNSCHTIIESSVVIENEEKYYNVNGQMYTVDELQLFDLEEIDLENSDYIPDGTKKI